MCIEAGQAHLCDALECELLHEVDDVGHLEKLLFEVLDSHRKCSTEEHNLAISVHVANQLFYDHLELRREKLVSLHSPRRIYQEILLAQ